MSQKQTNEPPENTLSPLLKHQGLFFSCNQRIKRGVVLDLVFCATNTDAKLRARRLVLMKVIFFCYIPSGGKREKMAA